MNAFLTGCCILALMFTTGTLAAPVCNISDGDEDQRAAIAAGCMIRDPGKLLLVRNRWNGRLGFPGGFAKFNEVAQCTAHRETWEETGLQVEVGALAIQFDNGFALYHCRLLLTQDVDGPVPVPISGVDEISEILWADPHRVAYYEWRFPQQLPEILRLFDQDPD